MIYIMQKKNKDIRARFERIAKSLKNNKETF